MSYFDKALSSPQSLNQQAAPFVQIKPIWMPANEDAKSCINRILASLGILFPDQKTRSKVVCLLSSLVVANRNGGYEKAINWPHQNSYWSPFPIVGHKIAKDTRNALTDAGWMKLITLGQLKWEAGNNYEQQGTKSATLYKLKQDLFDGIGLQSSCFSDSYRRAVEVSRIETYPEKLNRKAKRLTSPKLTERECALRFKREWRFQKEIVEELNSFWKNRPLCSHRGEVWQSVTRKFSDESLLRGGRFYGGWTNLSSKDRVLSSIDGMPVCEIDVNACFPSLLMSLTRTRFSEEHFTDAYIDLFPFIKKLRGSAKGDARKRIKLVVAEILGSGNPNKKPSEISANKLSTEEWNRYRTAAHASFPALLHLGDGAIKDSVDLTFHESQILLRTMKKLMDRDISSFPMHDCLIVRENEKETVANILSNTFAEYCAEQEGLAFCPALSAKSRDGKSTTLRKSKYLDGSR